MYVSAFDASLYITVVGTPTMVVDFLLHIRRCKVQSGRISLLHAPEKGQAFGQRAKQAMSEFVFGKDVELRPHTIDRYGRLVARVIADGQDAGPELLKQGLCSVYVSVAPRALDSFVDWKEL